MQRRRHEMSGRRRHVTMSRSLMCARGLILCLFSNSRIEWDSLCQSSPGLLTLTSDIMTPGDQHSHSQLVTGLSGPVRHQTLLSWNHNSSSYQLLAFTQGWYILRTKFKNFTLMTQNVHDKVKYIFSFRIKYPFNVDGRMLIPASGSRLTSGLGDWWSPGVRSGMSSSCLPDSWQTLSVRKPTNFPIY